MATKVKSRFFSLHNKKGIFWMNIVKLLIFFLLSALTICDQFNIADRFFFPGTFHLTSHVNFLSIIH